MPQMAPLAWLIMSPLMIIILTLVMMAMYFSKKPLANINLNKTDKTSHPKMKW